MTSKERAKLRSIASNMDTILQIGKNPIGDTFLKQVDDALKAREMIKIHVLETCELTPAETALALAEAADCQVVQVIGGKVILFRQRPKGDKRGSYLDGAKPAADKPKSGAPKKAGAGLKERSGNPKAAASTKSVYKAKSGASQKGGYYTRSGVPQKSGYKPSFGSGKRTGKK